jgi:hypothetical protein
MTRRRLELAVWILAIALAAFAGVRGRAAGFELSNAATVAVSPWEALPSPSSVLVPRSSALVAASEAFVARDPFRLERKPSGVAYSPAAEATPPAVRPPRPALAVVGIVGGPPWEALLENIPGRQGSALVRRGDTLSGLRIRSITKDTVKVTGMDTTWVLTVRRAWQ